MDKELPPNPVLGVAESPERRDIHGEFNFSTLSGWIRLY